MQCGKARIAAAIAFAISVAACTTTGQPPAGPLAGQRTTVAFESIDGPPPEVFQRLVRRLGDEAEARQVPVVTREGFAPYRIRGYVAVGVRRGQTIVAWVWDVYDAQAGRTLRLSGEEKAGRAGRDAWQAVNDEVLSRIARNGMEQLAVYFQSSDPIPPEAAASAVARSDDFSPQSHGMTRRPSEAASPADTAPAAGSSGPPRRPPARSGRVALAAPER